MNQEQTLSNLAPSGPLRASGQPQRCDSLLDAADPRGNESELHVTFGRRLETDSLAVGH